MVEIERKEVVLTVIAQSDIKSVFEYGEDTFGFIAAKSFVGEVYMRIWSLDYQYLMFPECRFLITKSKMYRNIIIGAYLIIYRITSKQVEVLRVLHSSHCKTSRIRATRRLKI
jgi:toxin ParE1/3/4